MKFEMNSLARPVAVLALCAVLVPSARAAEPAERYAVVCEQNHAHEEIYSVMSMDEYREASKRVRGEGALMRKALTNARREWKDAEEKRLGIKKKTMAEHLNQKANNKNNKDKKNQTTITYDKSKRPKSFPSLKLNMSPKLRCLGFCDSREAAESKSSTLEARAAQRLTPKGGSRLSSSMPSRLKKPTRSSSTSSADREADKAKAMEMFEAQLELVRRGGNMPGGDNGSVKRLGGPITPLGGASSGGGSSRKGKRLGGPITSIIN
ncbi:MAG: hypothetical protein HN919_11345 [Verrucomicrobia bacterium]|jgi:hypothetical protein|nr:hypothetical protein [Verrucomicrobiota bacterium]MBT7066890.1 hypothetical protein [Verrucomicrobiota bacterium]MBT7699823.1 hypothetical protein [Verrucomicrobiota bacterium]